MRILTLTSLFPNGAMPRHGIFVKERLRHLVQRHDIGCAVVAPIPWFPLGRVVSDLHAAYSRVLRREFMDGMTVDHPKFFAIPKVGNAVNPLTYAWSVSRRLRTSDIGEFDLIDAHYAFPDGVAATMVARRLNKPLVVTVRGSDINLLPDELAAGWWLRRTLIHCDAIVSVSHALAAKVRLLEPRVADRIHVIPNGVDMGTFRVLDDRESIRSRMGLCGLVVVSIGNLIELKGHDLAIEALKELPDATLMVIGEGAERAALQAKAERCGVMNRVRFIENVPQQLLVDYYNAADVLVSASSSEGLPNVVLECLACGTPVVATRVGGLAEVIRSDAAGILIDGRNPAAIVRGIRAVTGGNARSRDVVRRQVEPFNWARTSDLLFELFGCLVRQRQDAMTTFE